MSRLEMPAEGQGGERGWLAGLLVALVAGCLLGHLAGRDTQPAACLCACECSEAAHGR